jgi:lipopolysaccharide transport system ATP-binding protein
MAFQKKCLDKMRDAATKEGRTVLYVSHNMNTIRQLCDRCIVLDKGKIIFIGDVDAAIDIYVGTHSKSTATINLDQMPREEKCVDGLRLTEIQVLERNDWIIKVGEKLRFNIVAKATADLSDVGYRSRLATSDGQSVSVLLAPHLFSCKKGETISIPLEADVSELVPGRYTLTPVLYGVNEFGGWNFYDHIECAVVFEVETVEGFNENMNWVPRWWGNVKLPTLVDLRKNRR